MWQLLVLISFSVLSLFLQGDLFINSVFSVLFSIFTGMLQRRNPPVDHGKHKLFYLEGSSGLILQCRAPHLNENEALFAGHCLELPFLLETGLCLGIRRISNACMWVYCNMSCFSHL